MFLELPHALQLCWVHTTFVGGSALCHRHHKQRSTHAYASHTSYFAQCVMHCAAWCGLLLASLARQWQGGGIHIAHNQLVECRRK
jgi:hypothetical protein